MKKKSLILYGFILLIVILSAAFLAAYRYIGVGGKIIEIKANADKGFQTEYYLFIPDTLHSSDNRFLLVEPNNTGFVDDLHKKHLDAAHNTIRFGQANRIAQKLGTPLLVPCFDRPKANWERYTHALDRDTLLSSEGPLARIDRQLIAMIADARQVLGEQNIVIEDKVLLNGFSASGSFVNRFTALYPELVAGTAAGGINSMAILPIEDWDGRELIYPVGVADMTEIAGLEFRPQKFASVPQYYYMGENDENDALQYDDAYSDSERQLVKEVLGEDMGNRWENCKKIYQNQGVNAEFQTVQGVGHETTEEMNAAIVSFFIQIINQYK